MEDEAGQTWVLYHGYQASDVDAGRVTYLDRINWGTGGWPTIQGMRPSTEAAVPIFGLNNGISELTAKAGKNYLVLPTETRGIYRIEGPEGEGFNWQLVSANGITIQQGIGKQTAIVDCGIASHGMYIIRIKGKTGLQSEKILYL